MTPAAEGLAESAADESLNAPQVDEVPPSYGEDYIRQFDAMYSAIAKKYRLPMLPFLLKDVYGVPGMMQRDQTHATAKGNEVVARNVLPLVLPLLIKRK